MPVLKSVSNKENNGTKYGLFEVIFENKELRNKHAHIPVWRKRWAWFALGNTVRWGKAKT